MATAATEQHPWLLVDAEDLVLGRLASKLAHLLQGKHRVDFQKHLNQGPHIVVVNCDKITVTGKKETDKKYYRHTGYPGGLKVRTYKELSERHPTEPLRLAVKNMLPRGPLGRQLMKKLRLFAGDDHIHHSQEPQAFDINY